MTTKNTYGGLDLTLTFVPSTSKYLYLETDIQGIAGYTTDCNDDQYKDWDIKIAYKTEGGKYYLVCSSLIDDTIVNTADFKLDDHPVTSIDLRIFIHNNSVSIWANDKWAYSYSLQFVWYPADSIITTVLSAHGVGGMTVTNINKHELGNWREAVFVDYEANSESVIQSIIQQRPLEILPDVDNEIIFTYHNTKDTVVPNHIISYDEDEVTPSDVSSDGLVYAIELGISLYEKAAKDVGFITRLYRLSELDSGIVNAAKNIQEKALERRHPATVQMRLDPRIEFTDILDLDLTVTGTKTVISRDIIVEGLSIAIQNGSYSLTATGRRDEPSV
jgi:hypothetical protein